MSDLFGDDFSSARVGAGASDLPIIQWMTGNEQAVGYHPTAEGGWFINGDRLAMLGLDVEEPLEGWEVVDHRFASGNTERGWLAPSLDVAFSQVLFQWEVGGQIVEEYQPGARSNLKTLVWVRQIHSAAGIGSPIYLCGTGISMTKPVQAAIRETQRMAAAANQLRIEQGKKPAVAPEAFWVTIARSSEFEPVGQGSATSRVIRPVFKVPEQLGRDYLATHLVPSDFRSAGGFFDQWAENINL